MTMLEKKLQVQSDRRLHIFDLHQINVVPLLQ